MAMKEHSADTLSAIPLYSTVNGPIEQLSFLRRSLLFAEIANMAYLQHDLAAMLAERLSLTQTEFFNRSGAQAFIFGNAHDCVVACRGTEPNEWNDIKADVDAVSVVAETVGRVHRGFKQEVDDLWPMLEKALIDNTKTLWFTGHSLGGAMAAISAGRCLLSHINSNPQALYTYGSPRVGNKRYINYYTINYTRWVNNNDIVTRVPPTWLGYRHTGKEMYLDANGKICRLTALQRSKDRWRGFIRGLKAGKIDHFSDHLIDNYIAYIHAAVQEEESLLPTAAL